MSIPKRSSAARRTNDPVLALRFEHCGETEYARFLARLDVSREFRRMRQRWRVEFIDRWPKLALWFAEPLHKRIGRLAGETQKSASYPVSYRARSYLYYLALTDRLRFDYEFLLAVADLCVADVAHPLGLDFEIPSLTSEGVRMGYQRASIAGSIKWAVCRLALHTGVRSPNSFDNNHISDLTQAVERFPAQEDLGRLHSAPERIQCRLMDWTVHIHRLRMLLHHRGQNIDPPPKIPRPQPLRRSGQRGMHALVNQWLAVKNSTWQKTTVDHAGVSLRHFLWHLERCAPDVRKFSAVKREHALSFMKSMSTEKSTRTGAPLSVTARRARISAVSHFLSDATAWGWSDIPTRPLFDWRDLPRLASRIPRFIPQGELAKLMDAIRALSCPYQRAALLTARWSGARRGEISRLIVDCLDRYPDGTARLRIPVGKTSRERMVPLHQEAAEALQVLIDLRRAASDVKVVDERTGDRVRFLFFRRGKRMSTTYLFDYPLRDASRAAGLRTAVTAHRFRHTVGTQLAERGAKLHTIMSVLGHESPHMSMVYARISDAEVLKDYRSVLAPGAIIAGRGSEAVRSGQLSVGAVNWLRSNFLKTELELGHCLRLPSEGPCECDLYLNCAKFVTTPSYAPRLRERHKLELALAYDARKRAWPREAERHCGIAKRIECLLADLGQPLSSK